MIKKKYVKIGFVLLFIILAGIFYSCRADNNDKVTLLTGTEEVSTESNNTDNSSLTEDNTKTEQSIQTNESSKSEGSTKTEINMDEVTDSKPIDSTSISDELIVAEDTNGKEASSNYIYVHICGEVLKPNVYKVRENTRIYEVITKAGGLKDSAADSYINQASIVSDGQQIFIPSKDEVANTLPTGLNSVSSNEITETANDNSKEKIDLNLASAKELMTLNGIGQAKAQAIIDYRISNRGFKSIDEIKNIDGIKDTVYNKIKDKIRVN